MSIQESVNRLATEFSVQATKLGVLAQIVPDALYMISWEDIPDEYKSPEGIKSFTGLPFIWRQCADVPLRDMNPQVFGAVAHFFALIKRYDTLIDTEVRATKDLMYGDTLARTHLVNGILHLQRSGLPESDIARFMQQFYSFRETEWELYETYKQTPTSDMSFDTVSRYKFETCSLNNDLAASLISLYHPHVAQEKKDRAKSIFMQSMMAAQVYDDQKDFWEDHIQRVPNYLNAALAMFPEEQARVFALCENSNRVLGGDVMKLAPQAFALCKAEFQKFSDIAHPMVKKLVVNQYDRRFAYKVIDTSAR